MEDTLRGMVVCYDIINYKVLILVLMEDTLRVLDAAGNPVVRRS